MDICTQIYFLFPATTAFPGNFFFLMYELYACFQLHHSEDRAPVAELRRRGIYSEPKRGKKKRSPSVRRNFYPMRIGDGFDVSVHDYRKPSSLWAFVNCPQSSYTPKKKTTVVGLSQHLLRRLLNVNESFIYISELEMSDQVKYAEQCAVTNRNCMTVRSAIAHVHCPPSPLFPL